GRGAGDGRGPVRGHGPASGRDLAPPAGRGPASSRRLEGVGAWQRSRARGSPGVRRRLVGVVLVCAAASAGGVALRTTAVGTGPVRDLARDGRFATAEAVVTADPRAKPGRGRQVIILRARAEKVARTGVRVPVLLIADDPG